MGPIEYAIAEISFKVRKIYKDEKFANKIDSLAVLLHNIEEDILPENWETNEYLQKIQDFGRKIDIELKKEE